jgi:hypothetical protein
MQAAAAAAATAAATKVAMQLQRMTRLCLG